MSKSGSMILKILEQAESITKNWDPHTTNNITEHCPIGGQHILHLSVWIQSPYLGSI